MAGPKSSQISKLRVKQMDYSVRQQKKRIFLVVVPVDLDFLGENELWICSQKPMTKTPQFHKRVKHIGIQYHSIREQVQDSDKIIIKSA